MVDYGVGDNYDYVYGDVDDDACGGYDKGNSDDVTVLMMTVMMTVMMRMRMVAVIMMMITKHGW